MTDKPRRRASRVALQIPLKPSSSPTTTASVTPSPSSSQAAYSPLLPLRHHTNPNGEHRLTNPLYANLSELNQNPAFNQNAEYASHGNANARRQSNATAVMRRDFEGFEESENAFNYDYDDTKKAYYASKKGDRYDEKKAHRGKSDFARTLSERRRLKMDWRVIGVLTILAAVVRLFRISQPDSVVFDEVHFGGFASKYIRGTFFMDVHPPLGKLLIAFAGILAGFDGKFDFKEIGKDYIQDKVPYISMRLMPAIMGIMLVPIAYMTVRRSGCSSAAATVASIALLFENGLTTQARLILLDSPLLFFIALAPFSWVNFLSWQSRPFSSNWWFWLAMTGTALGLAVSVKWVGLFVIALIGLSTIKNLWDLLGDLRVKPNTLLRHLFARVGCLIVLPIVIYMFFFEIHFLALPHSGEGDGFFSSEFQQTLRGKSLPDTPVDVAYGAKIFIRHIATNGGYLHSHTHNWVGGSKQQQITLYPHRDENSYFLIKKTTPDDANAENKLEMVKHGDLIRLEHGATSKRLHSHDVRPPMSDGENHNEVSGYGDKTFEGDSNDYWRVDIVEGDSSDPVSKTHLRAIRSKFRLIHVNTGCHLFSHAVKLPEYAFGQQEVTCMKSPKKEKALWRIDVNEHPNLPPDAEVVNYVKPGFFGKFFELQRVMWTTNKGLTDSHPYDSRPLTWPFLVRGISFWTKERKQVYLIGNPVVWWTATACVFLFLAVEAALLVRKQRGYTDGIEATEIKHHYESTIWLFFLGWTLHYVPFFLMGRQLFLHHYFPALYFGVLLTAVVFDFLTRKLSNNVRWGTVGLISMILLWVFVKFSFITYGLPNTRDACLQAKWMENWDFDCNAFPEERPTVLGVVPPSPVDGPTGGKR